MHRIGLIVPSSNTTMETEIPELMRRHSERNVREATFHAPEVADAGLALGSLPVQAEAVA